MKKFTSLLAILMLGVFLAAPAYALPQLLMDEITKMKFTNFENWIDQDGDGMISAGDDFFGILTMTTITDVNSTAGSTTWTDAGPDEITGVFQISVANVSNPFSPDLALPLGSSETVQFEMNTGDFIRMFYDTTPDFDPDLPLLQSIATAADGDLWMAVEAGDYIDGYNETTPTTSNNFNWADLTVNNTGYTIVPLLWKESLGSINPYGSYVADLYFETKLEFLLPGAVGDWRYKSEDPVYLFATPEPGTMGLLGLGLLLGARFVRRRNLT